MWTIGSCSLFQTSFLVYSDLPNEPARIDSWHVVYVGLFRFSTTNGAFLGMGSSDVCHPYNALEGSPGWETLSTNPLFQAAQGISMASPCAAAFATLLLIPVRCRVPLWIIGLLYAASTACQIASLILLQSVDFWYVHKLEVVEQANRFISKHFRLSAASATIHLEIVSCLLVHLCPLLPQHFSFCPSCALGW